MNEIIRETDRIFECFSELGGQIAGQVELSFDEEAVWLKEINPEINPDCPNMLGCLLLKEPAQQDELAAMVGWAQEDLDNNLSLNEAIENVLYLSPTATNRQIQLVENCIKCQIVSENQAPQKNVIASMI